MKIFERLIYAGRWVIAPMYVGLFVGNLIYVYKFFVELLDLCERILVITEAELLIGILNLVDITMIGNLIVMIMIGGYSIFIQKIVIRNEEERPQWLNNINSGTLKVKMGMSLIGVSSIHLLKDFVSQGDINWKHVVIHLIFVTSSFAMAKIDSILHPVINHGK